jgi:dienelactone hydrolase
VTLDGPLTSTRFVGHWKGLGVDADFQFKRSGAVGIPLVEEDVQFRNGDVKLAGTLIRPAAPRRYAAVVWTHGSGDQRRSEDFYRDRGYLLAQSGLAALVYDKRGVGESGGDRESTLDELAGDAVAAVQFLQARPDIDPNAIGVGGFSQGGFVAPLAAARYGRIAFVVTGATPGVTPAELNDFAAHTALVRGGYSADAISQAMDLRHDVVRAQEAGEHLTEVESKLSAARKEPWFAVADLPRTPVVQYGSRGLSVLHFDPIPTWQQIRVPVLVVWGEDDALVPVERSRRLIEDALRVARNPDVTTHVFPHAGHGLALIGQTGVWDWPRLAPGFHELMVNWVLARVSR